VLSSARVSRNARAGLQRHRAYDGTSSPSSGTSPHVDAEEKTRRQAKAWGGKADEVCDRCYHEACDTIDNANRTVLNHYLRALAGTLAYFATSADELR
jgi:aminopeptidase S